MDCSEEKQSKILLELLIKLMQDGQLTHFVLLGGTALALQIERRKGKYLRAKVLFKVLFFA